MTDTATTTLYCSNHPNRETSLRCNRCEKPICPQCAVQTPTGYRCTECVRSHQKVFDTVQWFDYPLAVAVAGTLSFLGSLLAVRLGFFTVLLAPFAGIVIAESVRFLLRRRRGRTLFVVSTVAVVVGSIPVIIVNLLLALGAISQGSFGGLFLLIWPGLYTVMVTSSFYYRLSGIRLGR